VRKADNLPHSTADVTESGSLNLPEPSGPHRPVIGILFFIGRHFREAAGSVHFTTVKMQTKYNQAEPEDRDVGRSQ
jgi:hypothetical protein